jgi:hypothetical protein
MNHMNLKLTAAFAALVVCLYVAVRMPVEVEQEWWETEATAWVRRMGMKPAMAQCRSRNTVQPSARCEAYSVDPAGALQKHSVICQVIAAPWNLAMRCTELTPKDLEDEAEKEVTP